jgi:hypothetical protein
MVVCAKTNSASYRRANLPSTILWSAVACFDAHLDIVFIREEQERDLRKVCRPFYEAA